MFSSFDQVLVAAYATEILDLNLSELNSGADSGTDYQLNLFDKHTKSFVNQMGPNDLYPLIVVVNSVEVAPGWHLVCITYKKIHTIRNKEPHRQI